jgi:putative methionine-R-sulfoxide reductase with GAF domain
MAGDTVVGVLSIASRRQQPWDEERSVFLQAMGKLPGRRTLNLLLHEDS